MTYHLAKHNVYTTSHNIPDHHFHNCIPSRHMFQHWIGLHFVSNLQEQKRNTEHHKQVTKELAQLKNNTGLIANVMINFSRENAFITLP